MVNQDKLLWVFTDYGLNRQAEALFDNNIILNLTKIKVGDSNSVYYTPSNLDLDLKNIKATFDVTNLSLSEDETTVIFKTTFPENSNGYDIREVGLYEVVDGTDYLFALCTCQPILKPAVVDNYAISVDYYIELKSVNLASLYDQIRINPLANYLTEGQLDDIKRTMLYVESNLATQITKNTNVLGLDRAEMLNLKIKENTLNTSKIASTSLINTISSYCTDISNIKLLALFNCLKNVSAISKVVDFSTNRYNVNLNRNMALLTTGTEMFAPYVDFYPDDYFYLSETDNFSLMKNGVESPLTFLALIKLDTSSGYKNIFTKFNSFTGIKDFVIGYNSDLKALEVTFWSSSTNWFKIYTVVEDDSIFDKFISLAFTYNGDKVNPSGDIFINGIKQTRYKYVGDGAGDGLKVTTLTSLGTGTWEIGGKFKFNTTTTSDGILLVGRAVQSLYFSKNTLNRLTLSLSSNGANWNIASSVLGSKADWSTSTEYYIKLKFTGAQYIVSWSTDGITYTDDITVTSSLTVYSNIGSLFFGIYSDETGKSLNGTMDDLYVIKAGQEVLRMDFNESLTKDLHGNTVSVIGNPTRSITNLANNSYTGMRAVTDTRAGSFEINASNVLVNPSKSKISLLSVLTEKLPDTKISLLALEMLALVGEDTCQIF